MLWAIPDFDISPLLEWGWALLNLAANRALLLSVLVFALVLGAGVADLAAKHFSAWRQRRRERRRGRRVRE